MIKLSKNKISVIITLAALISAVISCLYAQRAKSKAEGEILNILQGCRRVREQNAFPHPTKNDLERLTGKGCSSIAAQIENNTYSDDDFGNHSRECAILILNEIVENMKDGETLSEYFSRK